MARLASFWKGLGDTKSELWLRGLLLLILFAIPIGAVLILTEDRAEIAGRYNTFAVPKLYFLELPIVVASVWWLYLRRPSWKMLRPFWPLMVAVTMAFLTAIWAPDPLVALTSAFHIKAGLWLLIVLSFELRSKSFAGAAAWTLAAAALVQAGWAMGQYAVQHDFGLQHLGESALGTGLENVAKVESGGEKYIRAYGSFPHPNLLAAFLTIGIFWVGTVIFWPWRNRAKLWQVTLSAWLAFLAIGLLLSFSRVIMVITAINGALVVAFSYRRWHRLPRAAAIAAVVTVFGIFFLWPQMHSRTALETTDETGLSNRRVGAELAIQMAVDRPVGVGAGNFVHAIGEFDETVPGYQRQPVHNVLLLIAAELGAVIAALVLLFVIRVGWLFHNVKPRGERDNTINFALFMLAGVFVAASLVDHFLWSLPQGLWLSAILAAALISRIPVRIWQARPKRR